MARSYTLKRQTPAVQIDYASELNTQQCAAVTAPPGPALVIAGAGSGKTRTLTYRVAYLIENGIPPSNILLLTFTNKAAREMLERVTSLLPNDTSGLWSGTFHSIGNRILRRHPAEAGFRDGFSIMDREDQQDMLDSVIVAAGVDPKEKRFPKGQVLGDIFSYALNTGKPLAEVLAGKYPYFLELLEKIAEVQHLYEKRKKGANALDFDDLLEKPLRMLQQHPELASHYQNQFQFILVDEYQDTNKLQAEFIDELAAHHKNVMVVGDDAQSIYSWRGANFQNILDFPQHYPEAKVYKIETNYRSVPEILQVANAAIAHNVRQFEKQLQPAREPTSLKPALVPLGDGNQQAQFVVQRILELREEGHDLNEIAVLYRAHFHSMELQMELTRHGVPFQITSGLRFFEQAHVKDVAAFLKFAANPRDEMAFKRMVRLLPGIGPRSAEQVWKELDKVLPGDEAMAPAAGFGTLLRPMKVPAKSRKSWEQLAHTLDEITTDPVAPSQMIQSVVEALYDDYMKANFANYEQRREDLQVLQNYSREFQSAHEFLDQLALSASLDHESSVRGAMDDECIHLSTVHQAKGLEWKTVFVIYLCDGMFPAARSMEWAESIEEERRLFYVAVTRARDELYLSYALIRQNAGVAERLQRSSRFLEEIPKELLEEWQISTGF